MFEEVGGCMFEAKWEGNTDDQRGFYLATWRKKWRVKMKRGRIRVLWWRSENPPVSVTVEMLCNLFWTLMGEVLE